MAAPAGADEGLVGAAATGSRLSALRALRDFLARSLDNCDSKRDQAALAARLLDVLAQIDELGGGTVETKKETALDEFTKRRNTRKRATA